MIKYKTDGELRIMIEGGKRLRKVIEELRPQIKIKMTTNQVNEIIEKLIKKMGGKPSFKTVKNYHWASCLSVNQQIVHTPPSSYQLRSGDVLTIDVGFYYQGFHTDYAETIVIGRVKKPVVEKFLAVGEKALKQAINQFKENNRLGQISQAIEKEITIHGYKIIKQLTGHGVGRRLHEDPYIPGYLDRPISQTPLIKKGMTVAIEVIYSQGSEEIVLEKDGWSLATVDGSLAGCFEQTLAITDQGPLILT